MPITDEGRGKSFADPRLLKCDSSQNPLCTASDLQHKVFCPQLVTMSTISDDSAAQDGSPAPRATLPGADAYSQLLGLRLPSVVNMLSESGRPVSRPVEPGERAVQIHYLDGHYVVSTQRSDNTLHVFDSAEHDLESRRMQLLPQLRTVYSLMYRSGSATSKPGKAQDIQYHKVPKQGGVPVHSLFYACAHAQALLDLENPLYTDFDERRMAEHFSISLRSRFATRFPREGEEDPLTFGSLLFPGSGRQGGAGTGDDCACIDCTMDKVRGDKDGACTIM